MITDTASPRRRMSLAAGAASIIVAAAMLVPTGGLRAEPSNIEIKRMQQVASADGVSTGAGPAVSTFTLPNGMETVVIEDHRVPVVTHMVWYRVGAADEARGQSGIAHFLEHLMFKGTEEIPSGRFSKIVAENGGQDNAFTSYDYTAYFQRIAKDRLGMVMEMEADRMANLRLTEEDVVTERDVVLEERSSRTDNDPQSLFFEQLSAALYLNHPYGVPVIGWRGEIEQLSREHALAFYQRHYAPDNAILVVAGDVSPEEVAALASEHYGPLEPSGAPAFDRPPEPPHLAERRIAMTDARVRQPIVARVYVTPSYRTGEAGQAEAMTVLGDILGGGASGRLYRTLVTERKIALDAGGYYSGTARDDGSFSLYGAPKEEVSLADLEAAIDEVIAEMAETGPTEDELRRSIMVLTSSRIYQQDSQTSMARLYGRALTLGLSIEDVRDWPERVKQVTAEQVRDAARSLRREASVTGTLTAPPEPAAGQPADERAAAPAAGTETQQ